MSYYTAIDKWDKGPQYEIINAVASVVGENYFEFSSLEELLQNKKRFNDWYNNLNEEELGEEEHDRLQGGFCQGIAILDKQLMDFVPSNDKEFLLKFNALLDEHLTYWGAPSREPPDWHILSLLALKRDLNHR